MSAGVRFAADAAESPASAPRRADLLAALPGPAMPRVREAARRGPSALRGTVAAEGSLRGMDHALESERR